MPSFPPTQKNSPRVKIEFTDQYGARYTLTVEGATKEGLIKTIRLLDIPSPPTPQQPSFSHEQPSINEPLTDTNFSRVYLLITRKFKFGTFSSKDILQALREEMGLDLSLPTVSAYLTRLFQRRILSRTRNGSSWLYRLLRDNPDDRSPTTDLPPSFTPAPDIITT